MYVLGFCIYFRIPISIFCRHMQTICVHYLSLLIFYHCLSPLSPFSSSLSLSLFAIYSHSFLPAIISKVSSAPAAAAAAEEAPLPPLPQQPVQSEEQQISLSSPPHSKPFHPFCEVDQSQISIHCHINAVRSLICVPGMVPQSVGELFFSYPRYI